MRITIEKIQETYYIYYPGGLIMRTEKPRCRLPDIFITSNLIGKTAATLRKAHKDRDLELFLRDIKQMKTVMDCYDVLNTAQNYVDFYE